MKTGMSLLVADFSTIPYNEPDFRKLLRILFREAWFDALLYLDETYTLLSDEKALFCKLCSRPSRKIPVLHVLTGTKPWAPRGFGPGEVVTVPFTISDFVLQRKCWENSLTAENISIDDSELDVLASRFRLTRHQIMSAVASAKKIARWNAAAGTAGDKDSSNVKPSIKDILPQHGLSPDMN